MYAILSSSLIGQRTIVVLNTTRYENIYALKNLKICSKNMYLKLILQFQKYIKVNYFDIKKKLFHRSYTDVHTTRTSTARTLIICVLIGVTVWVYIYTVRSHRWRNGGVKFPRHSTILEMNCTTGFVHTWDNKLQITIKLLKLKIMMFRKGYWLVMYLKQ